MSDPTIRLLTAGHAQAYRVLALHGFTHAPDAFTSTPEERAALPLSWWAQRAADPAGGSVAFGAFVDDAIVGTVALEFSSKAKTRHKADLIGMYVLESWRRIGVGQSLLAAALDHARERSGIALVQLTVIEGNAAAVRLYEAAGFQTFGVEPMAILTPNGYRAKIHMWCALATDGRN